MTGTQIGVVEGAGETPVALAGASNIGIQNVTLFTPATNAGVVSVAKTDPEAPLTFVGPGTSTTLWDQHTVDDLQATMATGDVLAWEAPYDDGET